MKFQSCWHKKNTSQRDYIKAGALVLMSYLFVLKINLAEALAEYLEDYEYLQLDELPFLLLFISIALAWFTQQRVIEKNKEIALRRVAEEVNVQLLNQNKALNQHILKVQELERLQLARDLHDDIGQYLVAIRLDASTLTNDESCLGKLTARRILFNAAHIQKMTKKLMRRLRPAPTNSANCTDAIKQMVQEWCEQSPATTFNLEISEFKDLLSEQVSVVAFRFTQEALTNIAKHANASQVDIQLTIHPKKSESNSNDTLYISIKDNGCGFDTSAQSIGMGIIGMRERIDNIDGEFHMTSEMTNGSTFSASIPLLKKHTLES